MSRRRDAFLPPGRILFCAGLVLVLSACLQDRVDRLHFQVSTTTPDAQAIPMHVAVLVPAAVSGYVWRGNVTGSFVGSAREAIIPLGEGLETATLAACQRTFRDCGVVRDPAEAGKFLLAIEPTVKDYLFRRADGAGFALGFKGELTVGVKFLENGRLILEKDYRGEHTGESKVALIYAPDDFVRAHQSAAGGAVAKAVEAIFRDVWQDDALRIQVERARQRRQAEVAGIQSSLRAKNASYRVTTDGAPVRELPQADAYQIDDYPLGSVVHVIGELPSGWVQVAREGKPFGWIHASALRPEKPEQGAAKAVVGAKPSIYIASPKSGDEVAESMVRLLGYVTSANRTEDLKLFVNHRLVPTERLWSDTAIRPRGLRGFPLKMTVPLDAGDNKIEVHVLDQEGFLVNHSMTVRRIDIAETASATTVKDLPPRLADVASAHLTKAVNADNFIAVLGEWVKDTAKADYNKGNTMFDQGRFARAAYYYRKSINTDPLGQAWYNLGLAERARGNDADATRAFEQACDLDIAEACHRARS